jgi:hypothetical protein
MVLDPVSFTVENPCYVVGFYEPTYVLEVYRLFYMVNSRTNAILKMGGVADPPTSQQG